MAAKTDRKLRVVADNRKARFNYEIGEVFEAGIALTGSEVKSLRSGKATIAESYADARAGDIWLVNANIPEYLQAGRFNHLPKRPRRLLLHRHMGEDAAFEPQLLARATRRQIIVRMLLNLKRIYVKWRSFPQARVVTDLLLAITPASIGELRDRGLLAYRMNDYPAALRDLEEYLKLSRLTDADEEQRKENEQVWEHVKALRRRVAALN